MQGYGDDNVCAKRDAKKEGERQKGESRTRSTESGSLTRSKSLTMKGATPSVFSWRKRDSTDGRGDGWRASSRGDDPGMFGAGAGGTHEGVRGVCGSSFTTVPSAAGTATGDSCGD